VRASLTVVLVALALALLPASAAAQAPTVFAQDISLTGQVIASPSATERTLRFTVTNRGPGSFSGKATLSLQVDPTVAYLRLAGACNMTPPATWAVTCVAFPEAEGAAQSFDVIAGFHAKRNYDRDQVIGSLTISDSAGQPAADADAGNGQVSVDMGLSAPPAGFTLDALIPGQLKHGETARFSYTITNTGGQDLTDIRVSDDRCPNPTPSGPATLLAGYAPPMAAGATCLYTPPAHVKGEPATLTTTVTATARAASGELVTTTRTFSSLLIEPERACGTLRARPKGTRTRTRFRVVSSVADRPCSTVRAQLIACIERRKAPAGFRCQSTRKFGRLFKPGQPYLTHMVARKS
jgi:hypothetical protein